MFIQTNENDFNKLIHFLEQNYEYYKNAENVYIVMPKKYILVLINALKEIKK